MKITKSLPRTEAETIAILGRELPRLLEGFSVRRIRREVYLGPGRRRRADLVVAVRAGGREKNLVLEAKCPGEPRVAEQVIPKLQLLARLVRNAYPVLAAPYLTESARRLCRSAGVGYLDLVGNAYLEFPGVYYNRATAAGGGQERRAARSLAKPKASRVVCALLRNPRQPVGVVELAARSGVSPAQAYRVAVTLETKGFAVRGPNRKVVLRDPGGLLDAWAQAQDFRSNDVVPAYMIERTPEMRMARLARAGKALGRRYALTMFAGASLTAPFARFDEVAAYVEGPAQVWLASLGAEPVESGSNLQLVVPRNPDVLEDARRARGFFVASDLQLYADLYGNPGRGREQAEFLRKERIGY